MLTVEEWDVIEPWLIGTSVTTLAVAITLVVRHYVRDSPPAWSSAMERLIDRNPTLNVADVRWSVASRRARTNWTTAVAVTFALLFVRPDETAIARSQSPS